MGGRETGLVIINANLYAYGYVLRPFLVPFIALNGPAVLMHDNARPHKARDARQFLQQGEMHNLQHLSVAVFEDWERLLNAFVLKFVRSMPQRVAMLARWPHSLLDKMDCNLALNNSTRLNNLPFKSE